VISPLLANLFLHYGFDAWMTREYPGISFERYADDVIVHCVTERQARQVRANATGFRGLGLDGWFCFR
jgi:retron-type reverse transcriptase